MGEEIKAKMTKNHLHMKFKKLHIIVSRQEAIIELLAKPLRKINSSYKKMREHRKDIRTSRGMLRTAYWIMKDTTQYVQAQMKGMKVLVAKKMSRDIVLAKIMTKK